MKVILRQDIEKLGKSGELIQVKDGYARNFLVPNGLAVMATPDNINRLKREKEKKLALLEQEKQKALELVSRLQGKSVNVSAQTYEEDKLYGSISPVEIQQALYSEGIEVDKRHIVMKEAIKTLGIFDCTIKPHPEVETKIKVWVVKK